MNVDKLTVDTVFDQESGFITATSSDVPGLVVEAESINEVMAQVRELAPQLLALNKKATNKTARVES